MNLLNNYALLIESMKFTKVEPINESAPDMQNAQGLERFMSGETEYTTYSAQWNQLVDHASANKGKDGTYTVLIKHDNGTPMINLKYSIKGGRVDRKSISLASMPAVVASAVSVSGETLDLNKLAEYDPKGNLNEFVAALITVATEKFGKSWTKQHIDWVNSQVNKCKALGGFYSWIKSSASGNYLVNDGNIFDAWIEPLNGGDRISQIETIKKSNKNAGSAENDKQVKVILDAIDIKMNETITRETDEKAVHGLYMLISPKYSSAAIARLWIASGKSKSPLGTMSKEINNLSDNDKKLFAIWCVGVRGATYPDTFYANYRFSKDAYVASVAAIKKSLI